MAVPHMEFQNGQKMPVLAFPTWLPTVREELLNAMNDALAAGYRHFITASIYANETLLGEILREWFASEKIRREELFIVSMLPQIAMDETRVEHFLQKSLAALQLDYLDLYLIHFPMGYKYVDDETFFPNDGTKIFLDVSTDHVKIWKAMEAQVLAGKTKAIGLSNFNSRQIERIVTSGKIPPANLQIEAHVYFQQKPLRETCRKHGITLTAYAPLGSPGRTKFMEEISKSASEGNSRQTSFWKLFPDPGLLHDPLVKSIGEAHGRTSSQILLRFLIQSGFAVMPKSSNTKRIQENIAIFDFNLTDGEMTQLENLDRGESGRSVPLASTPGANEHPEAPFE